MMSLQGIQFAMFQCRYLQPFMFQSTIHISPVSMFQR
jgi:hypothetical protein